MQKWIARPPDWLHVHNVKSDGDAVLNALDPGERDAILLTEELGANLILLDEQTARTTSRRRGLNVTGTLGILGEAGV